MTRRGMIEGRLSGTREEKILETVQLAVEVRRSLAWRGTCNQRSSQSPLITKTKLVGTFRTIKD